MEDEERGERRGWRKISRLGKREATLSFISLPNPSLSGIMVLSGKSLKFIMYMQQSAAACFFSLTSPPLLSLSLGLFRKSPSLHRSPSPQVLSHLLSHDICWLCTPTNPPLHFILTSSIPLRTAPSPASFSFPCTTPVQSLHELPLISLFPPVKFWLDVWQNLLKKIIVSLRSHQICAGSVCNEICRKSK